MPVKGVGVQVPPPTPPDQGKRPGQRSFRRRSSGPDRALVIGLSSPASGLGVVGERCVVRAWRAVPRFSSDGTQTVFGMGESVRPPALRPRRGCGTTAEMSPELAAFLDMEWLGDGR